MSNRCVHFLDRRQNKVLFKTPGVNFTNILRVSFPLIFLRQNSTSLKCKYKKVVRKTFAQKVGEIDHSVEFSTLKNRLRTK
jgi:hypothetical protein